MSCKRERKREKGYYSYIPTLISLSTIDVSLLWMYVFLWSDTFKLFTFKLVDIGIVVSQSRSVVHLTLQVTDTGIAAIVTGHPAGAEAKDMR